MRERGGRWEQVQGGSPGATLCAHRLGPLLPAPRPGGLTRLRTMEGVALGFAAWTQTLQWASLRSLASTSRDQVDGSLRALAWCPTTPGAAGKFC